jgi:soluble lytic murein transglycosylase-like protein
MTRRDFHVICDCQRHAMRERTLWRRSVRATRAAARQIRRGGVALLIGVSLAFGAIGIPTETMDAVALPLVKLSNNRFRIFTTPRVKREFLAPPRGPRVFTITQEVAREAFFRTEVPFGPIIYREAVRNNLPPELVAAVVEAESDFRPRLISDKKATGLMQIVPETGRLLGTDDLFDPEENVAAGAKYLRYLMDRFPDRRTALAAYNAGEGNVEKFGGVPPFPETLEYVRRVDAHAREYLQKVRVNYVLTSRVQTMVR